MSCGTIQKSEVPKYPRSGDHLRVCINIKFGTVGSIDKSNRGIGFDVGAGVGSVFGFVEDASMKYGIFCKLTIAQRTWIKLVKNEIHIF